MEKTKTIQMNQGKTTLTFTYNESDGNLIRSFEKELKKELQKLASETPMLPISFKLEIEVKQ